MSKRILIFSDGTGQAGGLKPDQELSNVYKLYRATRTGIDSKINPKHQVAFYDSGLGSGETDSFFASFRKLVSAATGLGVARNIADCYEEIIKQYELGDDIYLFGFSRGSYTARSVAGVMNLCGIPTAINSNVEKQPIPKDGRRLRSIAEEAIRVYRYGAGKRNEIHEAEREELGRRFREKYHSHDIHNDGSENFKKSNVAPYFVGVFDTVAALGMTITQSTFILTSLIIGILIFSIVIGWILNTLTSWSPFWISVTTFFSIFSYFLISLLRKRLKFITNYPEKGKRSIYFKSQFPFVKKNFCCHILLWHFKAYDKYLDNRTRYARHAIAIDEQRKTFGKLGWGVIGSKQAYEYLENSPEWFVQKWFSGNHSDIGGSYLELESRLSDVSLSWMVEELKSASKMSTPIEIQEEKLNLFPDALSMQHCEIFNLANKYPNWWPKKFRYSWKRELRNVPKDAPLHRSVLERFKAESVQHWKENKPYRPENLRDHKDVSKYYD